MNHIQGLSRDQILLFPEAIEDYVTDENPTRFLEAFVERLNLIEFGFKSAMVQSTGRPPYHPADLLKLYLYGYLYKVRSSRKLEREAQRNLELMWLIKKLTPDYKTIANFRKDNREALVLVCRQFTMICKELNLYGSELVAIDGSKFRAVNSGDRNFTVRVLQRKIQELDSRIEKYFKDMDEQDQQDSVVCSTFRYGGTKDLTAEDLKKMIEILNTRKAFFEQTKAEMEDKGQMQRSLTDPDSRSMVFGKGCEVGYNVQTVVDSKHHLIVDHEVTNDVTDQQQLSTMAIRAKETLGVEKLNVVADMGYYDGAQVKECENENILVYTAKPNTSANRKLGLFPKDAFSYDKNKDSYTCPAGQTLTYSFTTNEAGRLTRYYTKAGCGKCPLKSKCTRGDQRRITRWIHEDGLDRMRERVRKWPNIMKLRREIVEHPYGTMKRWWDQGYFLMRGLPNVRGEMSLTVFSYNLKRAIKILGVPRLVAAVS
ncbi:MAG: IS1182 family transposase ISPa90 [Elusimicrobia bacterium]|nr:IS1182 family transposase ISPa90 [Elusimicrobiota bacterium]